MIPWPRFRVLMRQRPRLDAARVLFTAHGVSLGYASARTGRSDKGRMTLDFALKRMARLARGEEADG